MIIDLLAPIIRWLWIIPGLILLVVGLIAWVFVSLYKYLRGIHE